MHTAETLECIVDQEANAHRYFKHKSGNLVNPWTAQITALRTCRYSISFFHSGTNESRASSYTTNYLQSINPQMAHLVVSTAAWQSILPSQKMTQSKQITKKDGKDGSHAWNYSKDSHHGRWCSCISSAGLLSNGFGCLVFWNYKPLGSHGPGLWVLGHGCSRQHAELVVVIAPTTA